NVKNKRIDVKINNYANQMMTNIAKIVMRSFQDIGEKIVVVIKKVIIFASELSNETPPVAYLYKRKKIQSHSDHQYQDYHQNQNKKLKEYQYLRRKNLNKKY